MRGRAEQVNGKGVTALNHRIALLTIEIALLIGALALAPVASAAPEAQSTGVPAVQLNLAASMEDALVQRSDFVSTVASFHATNATRFTGMEPGRQAQMIRAYLADARQRPWSASPDGSMVGGEWYRREAAAIRNLQSIPDLLRQVARAEGMATEEFLALRSDLLAQRVRRHTVFTGPGQPPQSIK